MAPPNNEMQALIADLQALRATVAALTARVYRLEQAASSGVVPLEVMHPSTSPPEILFATSSSTTEVAASPATNEVLGQPSPASIQPLPASAIDQGLESRIGSRWLNRIGIIAVLFGVSFFLKYAFENNWVGPSMRVLIGIAAGTGVVLWSERFRRTGYLAFSYSLKAIGVGVLYLSLWAGFQLYQLMPAPVAFAAMLAVTAATAWMAIRQNAVVLAAFALLGGFITPLLVSTHQNSEFALFGYVTLLDVGVLALIAFRPWRGLAVAGFFGTALLYAGWYSEYYTRAQLNPTLAFATLFFIIFSLVPVASVRREPIATPGGEISRYLVQLPLLNSAAYFLEVVTMLENIGRSEVAGAALAIAAYYLLLSWASGAELAEQERRLMRMLHAGLAVAFVTIAIPLKLNGHWITIGWLVETAALLWIARRINYRFLNYLSAAALMLGIIRLLFVDQFHTETLLFNERFFTYTVAIAVLAGIVWLSSQGDEAAHQAAGLASVGINVLALVALTYEVSDVFRRAMLGTQLDEHHTLSIARNFSYSALYMGYGAALMLIGFWKRLQLLRWQALVLMAITVIKVFMVDTSELERIYRILSFIILGVLLLAVSFAYQKNWLKMSPKPD